MKYAYTANNTIRKHKNLYINKYDDLYVVEYINRKTNSVLLVTEDLGQAEKMFNECINSIKSVSDLITVIV